MATVLPSPVVTVMRADDQGRPSAMTEVTSILAAIEEGDARVAEQLVPLVYSELHRLAAQKLTRAAARPNSSGDGLGARSLPADWWTSRRPSRWNSRGHFFAAAAEAMRRILIEKALAEEKTL